MTKLVDLYEGSITNDETGWFMWRFDNKWRNWLFICEDGSITNDKTGWFMWRSSITNDETGWFMWRRFDNKWRNWLIYVKKLR